MTRTEIEKTIATYLKNQGITKVGIFGSFARGEETPESDIDVWYTYDTPFSLLEMVHTKEALEKKLGKKIDLVSDYAITNPRLRKYIMQDLKIIE